KTKIILRPDEDAIAEPHFVWPALSDVELIKVVVALADLVLADFRKKDGVNIASATASEIRGTILGQEIAASPILRQQTVEVFFEERDRRAYFNSVEVATPRG
ncbi:hypothetical protein EIP86_000268, partial [Pleurotus ostreatoroseus]